MLWLLFFVSPLPAALGRTRQVRQMPLIIGGTEAGNGEFPFQVSIRKWGQHFCAGTIINKEWILTAAHCLDKEDPLELYVVAGTATLSEGGMDIDVDHYVMHPRYNESDAFKNDIAVVKLNSPLAMSADVQPVKLSDAPREPTASGLRGTAIGWGVLQTGGNSSDELQKVDMLTYDAEACRKAHFGYSHHNNFCAGISDGGKAHCSGDSGGPFLIDGVQVGIVSWSMKPCGKPGYPGVLTDVSFFLTWIKKMTKLSS